MPPVCESPARSSGARGVGVSTVWIDAQLSPTLAGWLRETFGVDAHALRALGLRDAEDSEIWTRAREVSAIVVTKDRDFVDLVIRRGPPPRIVWLTCGNTSNANVRAILMQAWPRALSLLESGEPFVEIGGAF
jgi:predicted nuclease of predicted toxin-antitoxin system